MPGKFQTQEAFLTKAKLKHGEFYSYDKVQYIRSSQKVVITCPLHGDFQQVASAHLLGKGCKQCTGLVSPTQEEWIEKAVEVHGNKYDYSVTVYKNAYTKVDINCPNHGIFQKGPSEHLRGVGCNACKIREREIEVRSRATHIHGDKYDYSQAVFYPNTSKTTIICPLHGPFLQSADSHLQGAGCRVCKESKGEKKIRVLLERNCVPFVAQQKFEGCKLKSQLSFDFFLPTYNLCIEFNGRHHYEPDQFFGGSEEFAYVQARDRIKQEYCKENNITLLVIHYKESVEKKLSEVINLKFDGSRYL